MSKYVSKINSTVTNTYNYEYDANGNITEITNASGTVQNKYYYDDLGQLVREDNLALNKTYVWTYDNAGNITSKKTYAYTTGTLGTVQSTKTYTYGDASWGDLLTNFDGTSITYDSIGNPQNYYSNTFDWDLGWVGRQLTSAVSSLGDYELSFEYNDEGVRTSKLVNGVEHIYTVNGTQILSEAWGNNLIVYFYDDTGSPIGYAYRTTSMTEGEFYYYVYEKNLQGDVVAIYNTSGTKLVAYKYDAWGNVTYTNYNVAGSNVGAYYNSIRYRGYYYDTETGLYYLNSRYYDPNTGRCISADTIDILYATPMGFTDKNLFAYCDNNPVVRVDYGGDFWHIVIGAAVGAVIGAVITATTSYLEDGTIDWVSVGISAVSGAASGALASTSIGVIGIIAGNAAISMAENVASQVIENNGFNNFDVGDMLIDGVIGGVSGAIGGAGKGTKHLTNLGKQTVKRTFNTTANKGLRAGVKEVGKAFAYYGKNTAKYYKDFLRGIPGEAVSSIGVTIASSKYMKYQYQRLIRFIGGQ